jgi:hypothetical protein
MGDMRGAVVEERWALRDCIRVMAASLPLAERELLFSTT